MSKILVTGAAGYIGSVLVEELLSRKHAVVAVDNFMYGQNSLLHLCRYPGLAVVRGDVRDKELMRRLLVDADYIIPLACLVGAPACDKDPVSARSINYDAIKMLLKLRSDTQRIIYPNTNSGYGVGHGVSYCDETTALRPISLYGRTKVDAEKAILDSENSLTFRLATVFGVSPRMRLDLLVNDFVYRAVNDRFVVLFEAHFKRNYIHVQDVAQAFLHAVDNFDAMKGEPYNVGLDDANLSKLELCEEIRKQVPDFVFMESEIGKDPDKRNYVVSNAKLAKTGFVPEVSLPRGIAELKKGYTIIKRNQFSNI